MALLTLAVGLPHAAAAQIEAGYIPEDGDIEPLSVVETVTECLNTNWKPLSPISTGPWKFFVWVEDQSPQQMLARDTIDVQITWDIDRVVRENDFVITYHSTAWPREYHPITPTTYSSAPLPRHALYDDVWSRGNCGGLMFDTGATYLGRGAEVTIDVLYEDLTIVEGNTFDHTIGVTNEIATEKSATVSATISTKEGVQVGGSHTRTRTLTTSDAWTFGSGVSYSVTPSFWTGGYPFAVGGGGPLQWACEEYEDWTPMMFQAINWGGLGPVEETCEWLQQTEQDEQEELISRVS